MNMPDRYQIIHAEEGLIASARFFSCATEIADRALTELGEDAFEIYDLAASPMMIQVYRVDREGVHPIASRSNVPCK